MKTNSPKLPVKIADRPEIMHWRGQAEQLEIRYNELLSDYNSLESESGKQAALIVRMKNREGILLGFVAASAFFVVMAIYWG